MSEYASNRTNQAPLKHESTQEPLLYPEGEQLFSPSKESTPDDEESFRGELQPVVEYPRTVQSWRNEIRSADETYRKALELHMEREDTPYEEHGGGLRAKLHELIVPAQRPLESIIRAYQPYQWEVATAINQFGIGELTPQLIDEMSKRDRNLLACHFEQFLEVLKSRPRILESFEGEVHFHQILHKQYGDTSPHEMMEYAKTLRVLRTYIRDSGITERLLHTVHGLKGDTTSRGLYVKNDRHNKGPIHVVFKTTQTGRRQATVTHEADPGDQS